MKGCMNDVKKPKDVLFFIIMALVFAWLLRVMTKMKPKDDFVWHLLLSHPDDGTRSVIQNVDGKKIHTI